MINPSKFSVLLLVLLLGCLPVNSQYNELIDSLKNELANSQNTDDSIYYLCRLAWRTQDSYSKEKVEYGMQALKMSANTKNKRLLSEIYDAVATGYRATNNTEKAKEYFLKSFYIAEEDNIYERMGYSMYNLTKIARQESEYINMRKYVNISRINFKKAENYAMLEKATFLPLNKNIPSEYYQIDSIINDIIWILEETDDTQQKLGYYLTLTSLYNKIDNKNQSLYYVQLAIDIAEKTENNKALTKAYYFIASYFRYNQRNYEVALKYLNKIHEIQLADSNEVGIADVLKDIGTIYKLLEKDSLALDYYNKSLAISTRLKYKHSISDAFNNMGDIYYKNDQYNKALKYYKNCYETGCDYCAQIVFHPALRNMGNVYLKAGNYDSAELYFEKSLALADSFNANYQRAESYACFAEFYELKGDLKSTQNYYLKSFENASNTPSLPLQTKIAKELSRIFSQNQNYKKAYYYLNLSKQLADSLEKISTADNQARFETRFEFQNLQLQKEIEKAQADKEIAKQKLIRNFSVIGLILISLLGIIIFFGYRRKRKDNVKLNEQKLAIEEMSKQVHEADQAKLQFFTNISHELRTPLTLILGVTEKLKSITESLQFTNIIRRNSLKLLQLINHLLDLRKLDNSMMCLNVSKGNISDFIKGIIGTFEEYATQNKVKISFHSLEEDISGFFDENVCEKILSNLISNGIKYNKANGILDITLKKEEYGQIKIEVKDDGVGIAPDELPNIFKRFYRVEENEQRGSGVGLALVKELVELHKGKIDVSSIKNKGTIFTVAVPILEQFYNPEEIGKHKAEQGAYMYIDALENNFENEELEETDQPNPEKESVLIVEDNADLRKFIAGILENKYHIICAKNGEEGLLLSKKYIPNIIISDIMMPKLSGIQMVDKLKTNITTSHIPVILLTAKDDLGTRLSGFEKGADDYISKPFDSTILKSRVNNLLRIRKQLVEKFSKQFQLEPKEITIEDTDKIFLEKTIEIIEQHISNPNLNIDLLAIELGVSRTQLYRKLKALTDYSANQFIRIIRLKRAAQILRQGQNNIAEVMDATGFNNYSYFNNCFNEYFGEYPKNYALLSVKGSLN